MNTGVKGALLAVGAYAATMVACACTSLTTMVLMDSNSCSAATRAMLVLWVIIAALFLASVAVVGVLAGKVVAGIAGRLAIVGLYGVVMLVSYVVVAFGLMVAFNC